ncbi:uncharacterized protein [Hetaerina americana]
MVASIQESENHWCSNVEAKNLDPLEDGGVSLSFNKEVDVKEDFHFDIPQDPLEDGDVSLFINEEVDFKEDCHFDIPQEDKFLGTNLLQEQERPEAGWYWEKC